MAGRKPQGPRREFSNKYCIVSEGFCPPKKVGDFGVLGPLASFAHFKHWKETQCLPKDHPPRCFSTRSAPISVPKLSGRPSNLICSR